MLSLQTMGDEMEREKARMRVTDAMLRKARAGHCCGGRVFGYDNVEIVDASGRRSHVERVVNATEAAIVRRIFDLCAAGTGYTRIAKLLNAEHAPAPRPKPGRLSGWAPSSVKEIIDRRLYLGEVVWNRTRKCDVWGQKNQQARPETEWIRRSAPALGIISDDQWHAAHGRLAGTRERLKTAFGGMGHPQAHDIDSRYLLSGFARCAVCGGGLGVTGGSHSSAKSHVYGCIAYHKRGASVCGNRLKIPIDRLDDAVLTTLAGDVLRPAVIMAVVDGVLARLEPKAAARDAGQQRTALEAVEREIGNLAKAIAAGGQLEPLLVELRARQTRRDELLEAMAVYEGANVQRFDRNAIERKVRQRIDGWRALLTKHTSEGRQLLREVLAGPLRFTPEGRTYRFEGELAVGRLLAGMAGLTTTLVAVRGIEPRFDG
jgi:site-specific DNA recombinase